jgi:hypothetical protein
LINPCSFFLDSLREAVTSRENSPLLGSSRRDNQSSFGPLFKPATYADVGELAFGTPGRLSVNILFSFELMVAACGFLVIASSSLISLFPTYLTNAVLVKCSLAAFLALTTFPDSLGCLSYFSGLGLLTLMNVAFALLYDGIVTPSGLGSIWEPQETWIWPASLHNLASSIGMIMVALDGTNRVLFLMTT